MGLHLGLEFCKTTLNFVPKIGIFDQKLPVSTIFGTKYGQKTIKNGQKWSFSIQNFSEIIIFGLK